MAPRSLATATISFGLVSIPVRLYPAAQPSAAVSFNLLHARCGARLKQQYVCSACGEKVDRDETVKGYEVAKDRWVTFTTEELRALDEIASQAIDIAEFVPAAEVDPIYFDRAYHLGPDRGGGKAYRLLALALERAGKAAVARYAARGKQYLVLVRAREGRLVMQQLYHADEVRPAGEVPVDDVPVKDAEVELAVQLVEQGASARFRPDAYDDAVKRRVLEAIERKVQGEELKLAPPAEPQGQVIDLMDALRASLAAGGAAPPPPVAREPGEASPALPSAGARRPPRRAAAGRAPEERTKSSSRK
jgi:DNA end-binding protein Ku